MTINLEINMKTFLLIAVLALVGCGGGGDARDCHNTELTAPDAVWLAVKGATYTAGSLDYGAAQAGSEVAVSGSFDLSVEGYGTADITVRARLYDSLSTTQSDVIVAVVKTTAGSKHQSRVTVPEFVWSPSTAPRTAVMYVYWDSTSKDAFVTVKARTLAVKECK